MFEPRGHGPKAGQDIGKILAMLREHPLPMHAAISTNHDSYKLTRQNPGDLTSDRTKKVFIWGPYRHRKMRDSNAFALSPQLAEQNCATGIPYIGEGSSRVTVHDFASSEKSSAARIPCSRNLC